MAERQPLFDDPSVVLVSTSARPAGENPLLASQSSNTSKQSDPPNALSLLLDSAIANAAKESTPELEPRNSSSKSSPRHPGSAHDLLDSEDVPEYNAEYKTTKPGVYSINELLALRNDPSVKHAQGQISLPDKNFWGQRTRVKERANDKKKKGGADGSRWEKKPSGFARVAELDSLGPDKINQLLGENPDEAEPDWGSAEGAQDNPIEMGETVEDFERWKAEMRRKAEGEYAAEPSSADTNAERAPNNEVDNFFSFVTPKGKPKPESSSTGSKSSRFSSFFHGPSSSPQQQSQPSLQSTTPQQPQRVENSPHKTPAGEPHSQEGASRFFGLNQGGSPAWNNSPQPGKPAVASPGAQGQPRTVQPPPGISPMFPPGLSAPQAAPYGPPHRGPPPVMPPPGFGGANDDFFKSLLSKGGAPPQFPGGQQPGFPPPGFSYPQNLPPNMKGNQGLPWMNMPPNAKPEQGSGQQGSQQQPLHNFPPGFAPPGASPGQKSGPDMHPYQQFPPGAPQGFMYPPDQQHRMPPGFPMYGGPPMQNPMQHPGNPGPMSGQKLSP